MENHRWVVCDGVGVSFERGADVPYVAALVHPMDGIDLFGPFINEEAAHAWVRAHGDSEAIDVYGNAKESQWFVKHLCIPKHWEAISDAQEEA